MLDILYAPRKKEVLAEEESVAAIYGIPDPFLGVRLNSDPGIMYVIERWDAADYRE